MAGTRQEKEKDRTGREPETGWPWTPVPTMWGRILEFIPQVEEWPQQSVCVAGGRPSGKRGCHCPWWLMVPREAPLRPDLGPAGRISVLTCDTALGQGPGYRCQHSPGPRKRLMDPIGRY